MSQEITQPTYSQSIWKGDTVMTDKKFYKVLKGNRSFHGGDMEYSLPRKRGRGYQPGKWHEVEGEVEVCSNGLHLTTAPFKWYEWGASIYEAEGQGDSDTEDDKTAFRRVRLLKPVPQPEWLTKAQDFVASIPTVPWLQLDGRPKPEWKLFPTRDAAFAAAFDAERDGAFYGAWDGAWDGVFDAAGNVARDAARDAERDGAFYAAGNAARDAARDAAFAAAFDAARDGAFYAAGNAARDAARDARLYVLHECICSDLPLYEQDREHVKARWEVWQRGYGLLCDVHGELYVYERIS